MLDSSLLIPTRYCEIKIHFLIWPNLIYIVLCLTQPADIVYVLLTLKKKKKKIFKSKGTELQAKTDFKDKNKHFKLDSKLRLKVVGLFVGERKKQHFYCCVFIPAAAEGGWLLCCGGAASGAARRAAEVAADY